MEQFVVPQFIDTEAKIIGPVTVRQFVIVLVAGFLIVISYKLADIALFVIEAFVIGLLVFLFGFYKVNGRPFHLFLLNIIETIKRPSIRVWRAKGAKPVAEEAAPAAEPLPVLKRPLQHSRLKELSLVVDTGGIYKAN